MGLLEKAMEFKKKNYSDGKTTVMDTVPGPASGEVAEDITDELVVSTSSGAGASGEDVLYLNTNDLQEVPAESALANDAADAHADRDVPDDRTDAMADIVEPAAIRDETDRSQDHPADAATVHTGVDDAALDVPFEDRSAEETPVSSPTRRSGEGPRGGDVPGHDDVPYRAIRDVTHEDRAAGRETAVDYLAVHELSREIVRAENQDELIDIILFSIMGQIGVSSSSIMLPIDGDDDGWAIAESRGMAIEKNGLSFSKDTGILKELVQRHEILDIEDFVSHPTLQDDYYSYVSFDARLLIPLLWDEQVLGVVILGNKLTGENYNDDEKAFLAAIAGISGVALHGIKSRDVLKNSMDELEREVAMARDIAGLQSRIFAAPDAPSVKLIVQSYAAGLGMESYAFFVRDRANDRYIPWLVDREDDLSLQETHFAIAPDANLVVLLNGAKGRLVFDDPRQEGAVVELLNERQLSRVKRPRFYPISVQTTLIGFFAVFRCDDEADGDRIDKSLDGLTRSVLPTLTIMRDIEFNGGSYVDSIETLHRRLSRVVRHAERLGIPLTLVLISIKNFKRFHALFGEERCNALLNAGEALIQSRLSMGDFAVRYDRHKILVVLPGKDKKYAVPFSSAIVNEMIHTFSTREAQLLVTALFAEFPQDGDDAHRLLDALEV